MDKKEREVTLPESLFVSIFAVVSSLPANQGSKLYLALEPYAIDVAKNQEADREGKED